MKKDSEILLSQRTMSWIGDKEHFGCGAGRVGLSRGYWDPRKAQDAWRPLLRTQRGGRVPKAEWALLTLGEEGGTSRLFFLSAPDSTAQNSGHCLAPEVQPTTGLLRAGLSSVGTHTLNTRQIAQINLGCNLFRGLGRPVVELWNLLESLAEFFSPMTKLLPPEACNNVTLYFPRESGSVFANSVLKRTFWDITAVHNETRLFCCRVEVSVVVLSS